MKKLFKNTYCKTYAYCNYMIFISENLNILRFYAICYEIMCNFANKFDSIESSMDVYSR